MKIISRAEFLGMPPMTVYQKYEPCFFGPIEIKMGTCGTNDWFILEGTDQPTFDDAIDSGRWGECCQRMEGGESIPVIMGVECRDGCFDNDQLFAIWERADLSELIAKLAECRDSIPPLAP